MKGALQQGHGDGLCGIYSLMNFLHTYPNSNWRDANETLKCLFKSCEERGWLNPHQLTWGYEDYQLIQVIEDQFRNYRMNFAAYFSKDIAEDNGITSFHELADRVAKSSGALIASWDAKNHWVLVRSIKGKLTVFDSSSAETVFTLTKSRKSLTLSGGVAILPKVREKTGVEI